MCLLNFIGTLRDMAGVLRDMAGVAAARRGWESGEVSLGALQGGQQLPAPRPGLGAAGPLGSGTSYQKGRAVLPDSGRCGEPWYASRVQLRNTAVPLMTDTQAWAQAGGDGWWPVKEGSQGAPCERLAHHPYHPSQILEESPEWGPGLPSKAEAQELDPTPILGKLLPSHVGTPTFLLRKKA